MTARHNLLVRSITTLTGDIAIGFAMASACAWIIQYAALGLFLSFLLWLLAIVIALAISQYALHPAAAVLLSDRKLDQVSALAAGTLRAGTDAAMQVWTWAQQLGSDIPPPRRAA